MLAEGIEVICVFDANIPGVRQTYEEFNVQVVFTGEDETADDYIERSGRLNTPLRRVSEPVSLNDNGPSLLKELFGYLPES